MEFFLLFFSLILFIFFFKFQSEVFSSLLRHSWYHCNSTRRGMILLCSEILWKLWVSKSARWVQLLTFCHSCEYITNLNGKLHGVDTNNLFITCLNISLLEIARWKHPLHMESFVLLILSTWLSSDGGNEVSRTGNELGSIFKLFPRCCLFSGAIKVTFLLLTVKVRSRKFRLRTTLTFLRKREILKAVFHQPKCVLRVRWLYPRLFRDEP